MAPDHDRLVGMIAMAGEFSDHVPGRDWPNGHVDLRIQADTERDRDEIPARCRPAKLLQVLTSSGCERGGCAVGHPRRERNGG